MFHEEPRAEERARACLFDGRVEPASSLKERAHLREHVALVIRHRLVRLPINEDLDRDP